MEAIETTSFFMASSFALVDFNPTGNIIYCSVDCCLALDQKISFILYNAAVVVVSEVFSSKASNNLLVSKVINDMFSHVLLLQNVYHDIISFGFISCYDPQTSQAVIPFVRAVFVASDCSRKKVLFFFFSTSSEWNILD